MNDEETETYGALKAEYDQLEEQYVESEDLPEEVDIRLSEIETAMEALQDRPVQFDAEDIALAGVFVSIDRSGRLRVERGYVRPEDEPPVEETEAGTTHTDDQLSETEANATADTPIEANEDDEEDGLKPLSDRLISDLTAHRTLALRDRLANDPQVAFLAAVHALTLQLFYHYGQDSCIEIEPRVTGFGTQAKGLGDTPYAQSLDARIERWAQALPKRAEDLWDALSEFDGDTLAALFAHCVAMTVNAVQEPHYRKPRQIAHAGVLAATIGLDMADAGWTPTADSYLGRVTKAHILTAVREAKGDKDADRIAGFKKPDMVEAAEELLAGTSWLPEPLRTPALAEEPDQPELEIIDHGDVERAEEGEAQSAAEDGETAIGETEPSGEDGLAAAPPTPVAAE